MALNQVSYPNASFQFFRSDQYIDQRALSAPYLGYNILAKNSRALVLIAKMRVKPSRFNRYLASFYSQNNSKLKMFEARV